MNEYTKGEIISRCTCAGTYDGGVEFCPFHDAALDMYEAVKAMVALIVAQYPALMKSYSYELMTEALSKVEGK